MCGTQVLLLFVCQVTKHYLAIAVAAATRIGFMVCLLSLLAHRLVFLFPFYREPAVIVILLEQSNELSNRIISLAIIVAMHIAIPGVYHHTITILGTLSSRNEW